MSNWSPLTGLVGLGILKAIRILLSLAGWLHGRAIFCLAGVERGRNLMMYSAPVVFRHRGARIILGDNVRLSNLISENPAGVSHPTVLAAVRDGAQIVIGNNVGISGAVVYAWERIEIGDYTQLGAGVKIYDTDFHPADSAQRRTEEPRYVRTAPIKIGKDVWIGADSTILKGVTVGDGAIIGTGAIVTRDIPAHCLAAGNPARIVGSI